MKNDRNICIRYYCWNNALTDEVLIGCTPTSGSASAAANAHASGSGIGYAGPLMGLGSATAMGMAGSKVMLSGPSFTSIVDTEGKKGKIISLDASTSTKTAGDALTSSLNDLSLTTTKNEDNGVVTEHVTIGSNLNFRNAAHAFTAISGYTDKEAAAIKQHGSMAVSADGSVSLFHDALTIVHSSEGKNQEKLEAKIASKHEAIADAAAATTAKLSAAIVDEGAMCIDESGQERKFGETWVYASDVCETCTCCGSGQLRCTNKVCDPYPVSPEGHYVVEEKADDCCMTYRLVKEDCDLSLCMHKTPKCSFYETLQVYPSDDCCATYECVCDPTSCPDLGDPACPEGSVRVVVDSNHCCKVGKCVDVNANDEASASAAAQLTAGGISITTENYGKKAPNILGSLQSEAAAGAAAEVSGVQEASVALDKNGKGKSYSQTIFKAGDVTLQTGANANALGGYGMYYGSHGGMGLVEGRAGADSGITYNGGHFETVTKTSGKKNSKINVYSQGNIAAKAAAAATGSQAADVYVSGDEGGESFTKMVYVPGKVTAASDANAQLAGHFGGYGMPGSYMGRLTGKAGAQSDLLYDGGSMVFTHHDHSGKAGAVKAALKGQLDADAEADVSGTHDALIEVDGGKTGGSTITTIFHPGQLKAAARADADMAGEFGGYGGFLGGTAQFDGSARAGSDLALVGGYMQTITTTDKKSGHKVDVSTEQKQSAFAKATTKGSNSLSLQIADEASLCIDDSGVERKYGECWYQTDDVCKFCSCLDADNIECKSEVCDPYPPQVDGKIIVEEKTSDCCSSYRYVSSTCDISECQFQPIICSPFERMVTYAIDNCCSTYECVCDESKCFDCGNPACPEGSSRVVVDQDTCCGVAKCVYYDASAAANAQAVASLKDGFVSIISTTKEKQIGAIDASLSNKLDASAAAEAGGVMATSATAKATSKKSSTIVTKFIPGQVSVGSSAVSEATSNLGWIGHGEIGGWKAKSSAGADSTLQHTGPSIHITTVTEPQSKQEASLRLLSKTSADATSKASGTNEIGAEVISDDGTCIDKIGKSRCYGEQWNSHDDICTVCTCHDLDQIKCTKQECDPRPNPAPGYKVVREENGGCCPSYRVVRESCDCTICQFSAPKCKFNEVLKTYPLDKCCATYECMCNPISCPVLAVLPCPNGCSRKVIDPHSCCPVAKCVRDVSISADAATSVSANGIFGIFGETLVGKTPFSADIMSSINSEAEAKASAKTENTALVKVSSKEKGFKTTSTIVQIGGVTVDQQARGSAHALGEHGYYGFVPSHLSGKADVKANANALLHDGGFMQTIVTSGSHSGSADVNISGKQKSNAIAQTGGYAKTDLEIVTEKEMCTDENGLERYYGETWYYNGDACNLCTCANEGTPKCTSKPCDPYPTAPEGHVVVEEKADDCCYSYRIVKETCDMSTCVEYAPVCHHYEDLVTYKVDECCATYECTCNPSKCPRLENPPCPKGCIRKIMDSSVCCPIGKCVKIDLHADAQTQSDLLYDGGSMVFTHHDHSGKAGAVKAALKGQLDADAEADVSGTHDALIEVDGGKTGGSTITTIFHPGQLKAAAQADADMAGEFGGYGGFLGGKAQLDGSARAGSDLTFGGGHFEMITKTGGDGGHDIDISSKSDLALKAAAAATGSQAADVYVSGDEGGESFTKMVYVPGKVAAASDANAQLAGHFGGYGMPGDYLGSLSSKASSGGDASFTPGKLEIIHSVSDKSFGSIDLNLLSKANTEASTGVDASLDVVVEADICTDSTGRDHKYGDTWIDDDDKCKSCTCVNVDDVR